MIFLCAAADVPLHGALRVSRGRLPAVAVFNLDGHYYVTDDRCTHGKASLSAGAIDEGEVVCPLHAGSFDIRTGAAIQPPCVTPLRTYRVDLVDGAIHFDPESVSAGAT